MAGRDGHVPAVSIGMPVFNAEGTVGEALEALLDQTFADIEVVLSDNASSDATGEICRRYAARDTRIRYFRQPHNMGAGTNFRYVLGESRGTYFMWAAADDRWLPTFVERNFEVLAARPDVVLSVSRVRLDSGDWHRPGYAGTFPIQGTYRHRLRQYLRDPGANSRFYGCYRREEIAAAAAAVGTDFPAADWAMIVALLRLGSHHEVPETLMVRGNRGYSIRPLSEQVRRAGLRFPESELPLWRFTRWFLGHVPRGDALACLDLLVYWNLRFSYRLQKSRLRRSFGMA